jgi:MFS family permease
MLWTPTYISQHFGLSSIKVAWEFGILITVLGVIGPLIAGPVSDWVNKRVPGGRLYVTLGSLVVYPLIAVWTYQAEDVGTFYLRFVAFSLTLTMWLPPVYAGLVDLVLPRMRGTSMSFNILAMTIVGMGLGPYAVGMISDLNGHDLAAAISSLFWLSPAIALLTLWLVLRFPKDEGLLIQRARDAGEEL